jgi:uncharacterized protein with PQ loop repeat
MNCSADNELHNPKTKVDIMFAILVNIANVVNILYNIPQMYHTYKCKNTSGISPIFLHARFYCSILWTVYCIYYRLWYILVSWLTTGTSTVFMLYYMHVYPRIEKRKMLKDINNNNDTDILITNTQIDINNDIENIDLEKDNV